MPNMLVSARDKTKPKYVGDICKLNKVAKSEIINHFYNDKGKRTQKTVAYFGIEKKS